MAPEMIMLWVVLILAGTLTLTIASIYCARGSSLGSVG